MMQVIKMITTSYFKKTFASLAVSVAFITGSSQAIAGLVQPAQSPLILSESVAPNMIFTLDDSGSMRWAYAPDSMDAQKDTRRAKSSYFNPLYYNPAVTYPLPIKYNADGSRASSQYTTTFAPA